QLEVVTPERKVVGTEADGVQLPGAEGHVGLLPARPGLTTLLKPGVLSSRRSGRSEAFAVSSGFAEVLDDRVSVLADSAQSGSEIDARGAGSDRAKGEGG